MLRDKIRESFGKNKPLPSHLRLNKLILQENFKLTRTFGEQYSKVHSSLMGELTKDLPEEHYLPLHERSQNKNHSFDSDTTRDIIKLLHQRSPHESRFESIEKFPQILSLNTRLYSKIDFEPTVSRKFNEVFKPNPTSQGLIHFDVNYKHVLPREKSFFITNPTKSSILSTIQNEDKTAI